MTTKLAEGTSKYGPISKIGLSDGCGGKSIPVVVGFGYGWGGNEGYLGKFG